MKHKLGLSDAIIEKTAYVYRKAQESGFTRDRSVSAILTAAVYISCRELGIPKTYFLNQGKNEITVPKSNQIPKIKIYMSWHYCLE